jgi:hypothetical protein
MASALGQVSSIFLYAKNRPSLACKCGESYKRASIFKGKIIKKEDVMAIITASLSFYRKINNSCTFFLL